MDDIEFSLSRSKKQNKKKQQKLNHTIKVGGGVVNRNLI